MTMNCLMQPNQGASEERESSFERLNQEIETDFNPSDLGTFL